MRDQLLVIEDDPQVAAAIRIRLDAAGYDIREARTGEQGLAALDEGVPSAVILDLRMPGIDGLEVCRRVRAEDRWRGLPVIVLSANVTDDVRKLALSAGANEVMAKPYEPKRLTACIERVLADSPKDDFATTRSPS